jgi:hypothetical protein
VDTLRAFDPDRFARAIRAHSERFRDAHLQDDGEVLSLIQPTQEGDTLRVGDGIELASWLVGQRQARPIGKLPRN